MKLSGIERFRFSDDEFSFFIADFKLVISDVQLNIVNINCHDVKSLSNKLGVYFFVMRLGNSSYKIYAGKTKSFPKRLGDYKRNFQEHSPNDYKLRFFQEFIQVHYPDAKFDMYFTEAISHTEKENEIVDKYGPMINKKASINSSVRETVKTIYAEYYSSIFTEKLNSMFSVGQTVDPKKFCELARSIEQNGLKKMTNHDMMAAAMEKHRGKILESSEIKKILLQAFPVFNLGSFLPNDHASGNKNACSCAGTARRIFDRVEPKKYLVR